MPNKIRVLIVDDLSETRENVKKLLQFEPDIEAVAQAGRGEEAIEMAKQHKPDIILMDINMPGLDGISASQTITRLLPAVQIIIMSVQSEADYLRRAMLAGARDFLMKPFTGDELITAIRRVHESRPAVAVASVPSRPMLPTAADGRKAPRSEGHTIAVYSPKGGSGCTIVASNLAVALASDGHNTVLIDGSVQFGDISVMLNMKPLTSIVDVIDRIEEMDYDLVSSVVLSHKSGLKVLLAPPRPEMAELVTPAHMEKLLRGLRHIFDFIVVDTSSSLNDLTLSILDAADRVLLVTQQNLPSLTNASRFFDLTDELDYSDQKVQLVVNRASSKLRISVKDIANTLKKPVIMAIPADDLVVNHAINQGQPLVTGQHEKRPIAEALNSLSSRMIEQFQTAGQDEQDESKTGSRLSRLFGGR